MTNGSHYTNTVITKSFKLTLLVFLLFSASFIILSALRRQPSCLSTDPDWQIHRNIPQTHINSSTGIFEQRTDISHVLFGISGSVHTWTERQHYSELWLQPNITRGFVWLDEEPDPKLFSHFNKLPFKVSKKVTGLNNANPAVRIARIVLESFKLGLPNVRWFVMGDDDTVFFAENLVSVLSKYDYTNMYYIGGNSESVEQDVKHSYDTAYGGGGFAVSYALAAEMARVLDACLDRYRYFYGSDERVRACVSELGVSLTIERGFHQQKGLLIMFVDKYDVLYIQRGYG